MWKTGLWDICKSLRLNSIFFPSWTFIPLLNLFLLELGGNRHRNNASENQVVEYICKLFGYLTDLKLPKFKSIQEEFMYRILLSPGLERRRKQKQM